MQVVFEQRLQATEVQQKGQESYAVLSNDTVDVKTHLEIDALLDLKVGTDVRMTLYAIPEEAKVETLSFASPWWQKVALPSIQKRAGRVSIHCVKWCPYELQLPKEKRLNDIWLTAGGLLTQISMKDKTSEDSLSQEGSWILVFSW